MFINTVMDQMSVSLQNLYFEIPNYNVIIVGGGVFER